MGLCALIPAPASDMEDFRGKGTQRHVSTDRQDTRRLAFPLPGHRGRCRPPCRPPPATTAAPAPGRRPFTHSSLWESA